MAYKPGQGYFYAPEEAAAIRAAAERMINDGEGFAPDAQGACGCKHRALVALLEACAPGYSEGEMKRAMRLYTETRK